MKQTKMPRDVNQRAKATLDLIMGESESEPGARVLHAASVELGRKGGLVGGPRRAAKLSPERRSEIARKAAQARWHSPKDS